MRVRINNLKFLHTILTITFYWLPLLCLLEYKCKESLPLTDMRYINGWAESLVLRRKVRDFFHNEDKQMKKTGFYIIDKFFEDMLDLYMKGNKAGNSSLLLFWGYKCRGIYWMISLSSRIDKWRRINVRLFKRSKRSLNFQGK